MKHHTPRKSTATVTAEARAAARIGACKLITAAALVAADRATRSLSAAARHPLARDISDERDMEDGIWIYLPTGWRCASSDCNAVHEDTVSDALECLKRAYYAPDAEDLAEIEREAAAAAPAVNAPGFGESMTLEQIQAHRATAARRAEAAEAVKPEAVTATPSADLQKKITAKRAAVTAAREAHAAAAAAHDSARERAAAVTAATPEAAAAVDTPEARHAAAQAAFDTYAAARTAEAVAAGIDPECDPRPATAEGKRLAVALALARAAVRAAEAAAACPVAAAAAAPAPSGVDYQLLVNADWNARCEVQAAARRVEIACREQGMGSPGHRHALEEQESAVKRAADIAARLAAPEITADNRAAAFAAATERVFSDMARNAARIEAERVKREAAAAEAAEARRNAAADFDFALISGNAAAGAAAEARFAAATEAATAASAGDFTAHAAHLARAVRPNPAAVAEAEAAEARARKRFKRAEAALTRAEAADFEAAKEKANAAFADLRAAVAAVRAARLSA